MKTFEKKGDVFEIKFSGGSFKADVTTMHTLEGGYYDSKAKCWYCPATKPNRTRLFQKKFKDATPKEIQALPLILPPTYPIRFDVDKLHPDLYPYQIDGVKAIERHGGVFMNLDDMGVGKSAQAISYCAAHPEFKRILIICPGFIKINWCREILHWAGEEATILSGQTPHNVVPSHRFILINYDILAYWVPILETMPFDAIIGDEIQYVANPEAQRTKAFCDMATMIPRKIFLSGTIMRNRPAELFTAFHLISPRNFPNRYQFLWRYCDPKHSGYGWEYKGATNMEELNERMKPFYIRRLKRDVLPDLPPKQRHVITFDMNNAQQREYVRASEQFAAWAESVHHTYAEGKACTEILRQIAYLGKRDYAIQWIMDFLESGQKLVVFVYHIEAIKDLEQAFKGRCVVVYGDTPMEDRQKAVDEFQTNPKITLFVGQIQAAGIGITLTAASDVVMLEFPWSPTDLLQAEDRVLRIGQKGDHVAIWYLVSEGTLDEDMAGVMQDKSMTIDKVLDGGQQSPFFGKDIVEILADKTRNQHANN